MFEFDQDIVSVLLSKDKTFRHLHEKHYDLKQRIEKANKDSLSTDQFDLEKMKKEKLLLKDKMALIIDDYRKEPATQLDNQ